MSPALPLLKVVVVTAQPFVAVKLLALKVIFPAFPSLKVLAFIIASSLILKLRVVTIIFPASPEAPASVEVNIPPNKPLESILERLTDSEALILIFPPFPLPKTLEVI